MKKYDEMNYEEQKEVYELFTNWLKDYTHEVIVKVLEKKDEIIENDFAMNLLRELKKREEEEHNDFYRSMSFLLDNLDGYKEFDPHNHPLTHSGSYRHVLYDLYIK